MVEIPFNGYILLVLDLLDPMQPLIFLKNQSLASKRHLIVLYCIVYDSSRFNLERTPIVAYS